MAERAIQFPEELANLAEARAAAGGYNDLSAYLAALVRADDSQENDPLLAAALAEGEEGPFADCDLEEILREASAAFRGS